MRRHRTGPTNEHYPNAMLNDRRLSYSASGLLLNLLAREDNPSLDDLTAEGQARGGEEKRADFREWLGELVDAGYLVRDPNTLDDSAPVATDVYDTSQK